MLVKWSEAQVVPEICLRMLFLAHTFRLVPSMWAVLYERLTVVPLPPFPEEALGPPSVHVQDGVEGVSTILRYLP